MEKVSKRLFMDKSIRPREIQAAHSEDNLLKAKPQMTSREAIGRKTNEMFAKNRTECRGRKEGVPAICR